MKKHLFFAGFFLIIFSVLPFSSKASHIMGADMGWKQLGKDTFLITVTVYRDCNGISMPDQTIDLNSGKLTTVTINTARSKGIDITPVCKTNCSRCGTKPNTSYGDPTCKFGYGIELFTFTATVVFGKGTLKSFTGAYCDVNITWTQCCRSTLLTFEGNGESFYVESTMNRCQANPENSPVFTSPPLLIVGLNKPVYYNPGVVDFDVDSLGNRDSFSYKIVKPLSDITTSITYTGKYSYVRPLDFDSFPKSNALWNPPKSYAGFHFDSLNGDFFFEPVAIGLAVIAFRVNEYRKDSAGNYRQIGSILRDLSLVVTTPTDKKDMPLLSGFNKGLARDTSICAGHFMSFNLYSSNLNSKDTNSISWDSSLIARGAAFTSTGVKNPVDSFSWTPGDSDVSTMPYQFVVAVKDNNCPLQAASYFSYRITVHPGDKDSVMANVLKCGDVKFSAKPKKGSAIAKYLWSGDDGLSSTSASFSHHYAKSGTFKYKLTIDNGYGCGHTDSGIVVVAPYLHTFLPADTSICYGSKLSIMVRDSAFTKPISHLWNTGDTSVSISLNIKMDTVLYIKSSDSLCTATDTMKVKMIPILKPIAGIYGPFCPDSIWVPLKTTTLYSYQWNILDTVATSSHSLIDSSGRYYFNPSLAGGGMHKLIYGESYSGKCPAFDTAIIKVFPHLAMPSITAGGKDSLEASIASTTTYIWYLDGVKISDSSRSIYANTSGKYQVQIIDSNGCISPFSSVYSFVYTGVSAIKNGVNIHVYPNPTTGILTIGIPGIKDAQLSVMNITGQVQFQSVINEKAELDLHTLPKGIYLLRIQSKDGVMQQKLILQ